MAIQVFGVAEVVAATSSRAQNLLDRAAVAWRCGGKPHRQLVLGVRCPFCRQQVVVALARPHPARAVVALLRRAGGCLHRAADAA